MSYFVRSIVRQFNAGNLLKVFKEHDYQKIQGKILLNLVRIFKSLLIVLNLITYLDFSVQYDDSPELNDYQKVFLKNTHMMTMKRDV